MTEDVAKSESESRVSVDQKKTHACGGNGDGHIKGSINTTCTVRGPAQTLPPWAPHDHVATRHATSVVFMSWPMRHHPPKRPEDGVDTHSIRGGGGKLPIQMSCSSLSRILRSRTCRFLGFRPSDVQGWRRFPSMG